MPSNAVATVAGNPISQQAYKHWFYVFAKGEAAQQGSTQVFTPDDPPGFATCIAQARAQVATLAKTPTATVRKECASLFTQDNAQVMNFLVTSYWLQADAHKLGITVTPAEVQKAFAAAEKQQHITSHAQLVALLARSGETEADAEYQTRVNEVQQKLLKRHATTVTQADIQTYYNQHKTTYGTPERRNLRIVLAKNAGQAKAALAALRHGQGWASVAARYSQDPTTKKRGGLLADATPSSLGDAAFSKVAFSSPTGKLVGPVKGQFGYYVLDVLKVTPATQQSLAQATPVIRSTLKQTKQQTAQTAVLDQAKQHWMRKTRCRATYAMADCTGYKPPKTTSSAAPTATTPPAGSTTPPASSSTGSASSSASASSSTTTSASSSP